MDEEVKRIHTSYSAGFYKPLRDEKLDKFKLDRSAQDDERGGHITVFKRSKVLKN